MWVVLQLLFLIGNLKSIGVCLGEDERTNTMKTHFKKEKEKVDYVFKFYELLHIE
jgi:hypothetical protein